MNRAQCYALVNELLRYRARADEYQRSQVDRIIGFIHSCEAPWRRTTLEGHLTASAWIVDPANERALLIHHKKLDKWLQPGGHIDDEDASVCAAALREAREETGLVGLAIPFKNEVSIFDVDVHSIPARRDEPSHFHYDIRYRFLAPDAATKLNPEESNALHWFDQRGIAHDATMDPSIRRMSSLVEVTP